MFKECLVSAVMVTISAISSHAATINSSWLAGGWGSWSQASNWNPAIVPDNNATNNFNVTIDGRSTEVDIELQQHRTINSLDSYGDVFFFGATKQTLDFDGGSLTNHGDLDITNLYIGGGANNLTGAFLELDYTEIWDDLYNQINATVEVWNYVEADSIENHGTIISTLGADLCVEDGNIINHGQIELHGGKCGAEGNANSFNNNSGAAITGWGILYAEGPFNNSGSIKAQAGVLRLRCMYTGLTNNGLLSADPSSSLHIKPAGDLNNLATINATAGDFIVDANLINSSDATIQILDGTIAAKKITQKPGAAFNAFGRIVAENGFYIETDATATITGPTNIIGNVTIESGATLEVKDGQTLITGQTTCNGTIHMKGGYIIPQGGLSGTCNVIWEPGIYSNVADFNLDGQVNLKDFAYFADTWLWQASWY